MLTKVLTEPIIKEKRNARRNAPGDTGNFDTSDDADA
jgi:hypothetical protein